jgi:hypothetical protein
MADGYTIDETAENAIDEEMDQQWDIQSSSCLLIRAKKHRLRARYSAADLALFSSWWMPSSMP